MSPAVALANLQTTKEMEISFVKLTSEVMQFPRGYSFLTQNVTSGVFSWLARAEKSTLRCQSGRNDGLFTYYFGDVFDTKTFPIL